MGGRAIKVSGEVYEKLSELAERYGSFSINEVIEKLLNNQCTGNPQTNTSGNQRFENTVENWEATHSEVVLGTTQSQ